jgi:hypothetical protein
LKSYVYERLFKHICTNKILVEEQFGFKSNSSTEKASYKLINEILQAMNNKFKVGGILYDLEKVFHCINHTILLDKLEFYGIKGKFLELIQSYLRDRFQKVNIENKNT